MWAVSAVVAYVLGMQLLRLRRRLQIASDDNVESVYRTLFSVEFPFVWLKGLELGLFNTFPHSSVFDRLSINHKFTEAPERRYDDTELLLREAWEHGVNSSRGKDAMFRLNGIHSFFNIDNDSFLYVLALFVITPIRLVNEFEFRTLTGHETRSVCRAISMMGAAMHIKNLPITYADYEKIVEDAYINKLQVDDRGKAIAESVLVMFLRPFPTFIHPLARRVVYALLDAPIRRAFEYPEQPRAMFYFAKTILLARALFIFAFMPTRPFSWAVLRTPKEVGGAPRFQKYRRPGCPFTYPLSYDPNKLGCWNHAGVALPIS